MKYKVLGRKSLAVVLLLLILSILFISKVSSLSDIKANGSSRKARIAFLKDLGCFVNPESETEKKIEIPDEFSDVYLNYNEIQKQAGFDLSLYKGCKCSLFSFEVNELSDDENPQYMRANLIVYKGRIIGGDISSCEIDGEMFPLIRRDEKAKIRQVYFNPTQFTEKYG